MLEEADDKILQIDEAEPELIDAVNKLEDNLMEIEMLLQDALHTAVVDFKDKANDVTKIMKDKTSEFIKFVLANFEDFKGQFTIYAYNEQTVFEAKLSSEGAPEEEDEEFDMLLEILGEKDPLV